MKRTLFLSDIQESYIILVKPVLLYYSFQIFINGIGNIEESIDTIYINLIITITFVLFYYSMLHYYQFLFAIF